MRSPDNQIRLPFRHSPHHNKIIYKHTEIWTSIYIFSFHLWSVISCNWSIDDARWFENKLQMYWRLVLRRWLDSSDKNITIIFFVIWFYSIADHYLSIKTNYLVYHIKLLSISTISELRYWLRQAFSGIYLLATKSIWGVSISPRLWP